MNVRALGVIAVVVLGQGRLHAYTRLDLGYYGMGGGSYSSASSGAGSSTSSSSEGLSFFAQYGWGQELGAGAVIEERIGVGPLGQYASASSSIQGTLLHIQAVPGWELGIANDRFRLGVGVPIGAGILMGQAASANAAAQGIVFIPIVGGLVRFEGALTPHSSIGVEAGFIQTVMSPFSISGPILAVTWRKGSSPSLAATQPNGVARETDYARLLDGEAAYRAKKFDVAAEAFRDVTEDSGSNTRAWQDLGNAEYEMGEVKAAIKAYRHAVKLDPSNKRLEDFLAKIEGR